MLIKILFLFFLFRLSINTTIIDHYSNCFMCLFLLFKMITNNRKCTISYIECKLRGVKKEEGYIYNALEEVYNFNKSKQKYLIYTLLILLLILNLKKIFIKKKSNLL